MTNITSKFIITKEMAAFSAVPPMTTAKHNMWRMIWENIINNFPIFGRSHKGNTEYELSVFVYSEEEIKKIIALLPTADTKNWYQAIYDILTKNRGEIDLPIK